MSGEGYRIVREIVDRLTGGGIAVRRPLADDPGAQGTAGQGT